MKLGIHEPGIESIQVNGESIEDAEIMANKFNNYIANSLPEKIKSPNISFEKYMQPSVINSFAVIPTSPEEIVNVGRSIRLTHSKGVDDIDPYIATPCIASVAWPLSEIINCSFK